MISTLSILGDAIIDSWHPLLKLLFGLVMGAVMLYFWYSFCLSFERAKRGNFYMVSKKDMERWEEQPRAAVTGETIRLTQADIDRVTR